MQYYYVYMLLCSDGSYYTGFTNDIDRRLAEHQEGINGDSYTHTRLPVELVFCEEFPDPNQAITFEKRLKNWSRKKKEALIEQNWDELKKLSACKNQSSHLLY